MRQTSQCFKHGALQPSNTWVWLKITQESKAQVLVHVSTSQGLRHLGKFRFLGFATATFNIPTCSDSSSFSLPTAGLGWQLEARRRGRRRLGALADSGLRRRPGKRTDHSCLRRWPHQIPARQTRASTPAVTWLLPLFFRLCPENHQLLQGLFARARFFGRFAVAVQSAKFGGLLVGEKGRITRISSKTNTLKTNTWNLTGGP